MKNLLWNKNTPKRLLLPIPQNIRDSHVTQSILTHLQMQTNGALMLTGEWGGGKTYFVKNFIFPLIQQDTTFKPILLSLYGIESTSDIILKIISSTSKTYEQVKKTIDSNFTELLNC